MSLLDNYRSRTAFALVLLLIGQLSLTAHAIDYGSEPHEHNGVICLATPHDEPEGVLPACQLDTLALVLDEPEPLLCPVQAQSSKNLATPPPATGPPSI